MDKATAKPYIRIVVPIRKKKNTFLSHIALFPSSRKLSHCFVRAGHLIILENG